MESKTERHYRKHRDELRARNQQLQAERQVHGSGQPRKGLFKVVEFVDPRDNQVRFCGSIEMDKTIKDWPIGEDPLSWWISELRRQNLEPIERVILTHIGRNQAQAFNRAYKMTQMGGMFAHYVSELQKPIICISATGKVRRYPSISAAAFAMEVKRGTICTWIRKKKQDSFGRLWMWEKDYLAEKEDSNGVVH